MTHSVKIRRQDVINYHEQDCKIIDIDKEIKLAEKFTDILYEKRKRKGFTKNKCRKIKES